MFSTLSIYLYIYIYIYIYINIFCGTKFNHSNKLTQGFIPNENKSINKNDNLGRTNQRLGARIKQHVPTKIQNFNIGPIDNLMNTYGSSIAEHLIKDHNCAEKFSVDLFSILS